MIFRKSIFTAASPNTQFDDVLLTLKVLFTPWTWGNISYVEQFEKEISEYTGLKYVKTIDSGRSALEIILKSLGIGKDHEVITPSFTCIVVANGVFYSGAKPVYLDVNVEDLNPNYDNLEKVITKKTKAILVQHTFGKMVDIEKIRRVLNKINRNEIILIEDFAHTISENMVLKGDVGFFTFGIEKVISSVRGGAVVSNNPEIFEKVEGEISSLQKFPAWRAFISLLNPIFWFIDIPLHSVGIGRYSIGALIRYFWRKLGFLGIMVQKSENEAIRPNWFPCKMSPALSRLGSLQLSKLNVYNNHRLDISKIYHEKLSKISDDRNFDESRVYLRYPIVFKSFEEFLKAWEISRSLRVTPGNWFAVPLYGAGVSSKTYEKLSFQQDEVPVTMQKCGLVMNLPTSVNMNKERAKELADAISKII